MMDDDGEVVRQHQPDRSLQAADIRRCRRRQPADTALVRARALTEQSRSSGSAIAATQCTRPSSPVSLLPAEHAIIPVLQQLVAVREQRVCCSAVQIVVVVVEIYTPVFR